MLRLNWRPTDRELRLFAAALPVPAAVIGFALGRRFDSAWPPHLLVWPAVAVAAVGLARPRLVRPVFLAVSLAAFPIGWALSHLILAAIFFLLVTPTGLALRLAGRDPMTRRREPDRASYWIRRRPREKDDYFRQY